MRKVLIAAPWVPAAGAAIYVFGRWRRLPPRIAVTFFNGSPSGWGSKTTAIPFMLVLMFGMLALFTALLLMPGRIRTRPSVAETLLGANSAPRDSAEEQRVRMRILAVAHVSVGILMPLSVIHIVQRNLL